MSRESIMLALSPPPPSATPCAPLWEDGGSRRALGGEAEDAGTSSGNANCRQSRKTPSRPGQENSGLGGWRWGRVELHSARPLTSVGVRRVRNYLASAPPPVHRCPPMSTFSEWRCRQNCRHVRESRRVTRPRLRSLPSVAVHLTTAHRAAAFGTGRRPWISIAVRQE
jgi:hypothetical protein